MKAFTLPLILPICFLDEDSTLRILPASFTRVPISNTAWMKARRIRSMRGVKNLEQGNQFFQVYNFMHNFFGKGRLKRILGQLGLKLSWEGLRKMFYLARDF